MKITEEEDLHYQLWDQLWSQFDINADNDIWIEPRIQLHHQTGCLWDWLYNHLEDPLWRQLGGQLRGPLYDQLRD